MKKRILDRTGLAVSELSLGGLFVSSHGVAFGRASRPCVSGLGQDR